MNFISNWKIPDCVNFFGAWGRQAVIESIAVLCKISHACKICVWNACEKCVKNVWKTCEKSVKIRHFSHVFHMVFHIHTPSSASCTNSRKELRRCCSPIGHHNTKHFLCPIRSQHLLDHLEMVQWKSVPRGFSVCTWKLLSHFISRPNWSPLGLRGWILSKNHPKALWMFPTSITACENRASFLPCIVQFDWLISDQLRYSLNICQFDCSVLRFPIENSSNNSTKSTSCFIFLLDVL